MPENVTHLYLHLVWSTWDRLPMLTRECKDIAYKAIHTECNSMNAGLLAIGGIDDHVHVLAQIPATVSVSQIIKQLKGASSHLINDQHRNDPLFRWQGGYGAFSVSEHHVLTIRNYIADQEQHHRKQTLIPEWEY